MIQHNETMFYPMQATFTVTCNLSFFQMMLLIPFTIASIIIIINLISLVSTDNITHFFQKSSIDSKNFSFFWIRIIFNKSYIKNKKNDKNLSVYKLLK